jgi:hypothetical protein
MVEQLFGSKTRVKLLQLFYTNPNRSFYVREITRQIDEQINSVRRELANLLSVGIIVSDNANNRLYYEVNQKYEHYDAFHSIFGGGVVKKVKSKKGETIKEEVVVDEPTDELKGLGNVELALYTGQFTRDESAGIDFLLVGDVNAKALENYVSELEQKEGKEIRYAVMTLDTFKYRRQINDRFIIKVLEAKKQILVDKNNLLEGK